MNTSDFVYKHVLIGCLNVGVRQSIATAAATKALDDWKKSRGLEKSVSKLIERAIADAKRHSKR